MLHVQQPALLRMMRAGFTAVAIMLASSGGAFAQTVPCFELLPAQAGIEPRAPLLVDKCTGRSWLLIRAGRNTFRWASIDMDGDKPKATDRPAIDNQPAQKDVDPRKCFTFNGRKFCE